MHCWVTGDTIRRPTAEILWPPICVKGGLTWYPRLEDQNLDDLTVELLYPTDEAAEHCIKEFLALRLDDDNEHELEQ